MAWNPQTKTAPKTNEEKKERIDPKVWINVGYDSPNPRTGENVFISTPVGIALDTMNKKREPNKESDYRDMIVAKNAFMNQLQELSLQLAPGEEMELDLKVVMRRVDEATQEEDSDANVHLNNLSRLNFVKRPTKVA
jgi:hypothetical protein